MTGHDQPAQQRAPRRAGVGVEGIVIAVHRRSVWHSLAASSSKAWSRGRGAIATDRQPSPAARAVRALIAAIAIGRARSPASAGEQGGGARRMEQSERAFARARPRRGGQALDRLRRHRPATRAIAMSGMAEREMIRAAGVEGAPHAVLGHHQQQGGAVVRADPDVGEAGLLAPRRRSPRRPHSRAAA